MDHECSRFEGCLLMICPNCGSSVNWDAERRICFNCDLRDPFSNRIQNSVLSKSLPEVVLMAYKDKVFKEGGVWWDSWLTTTGWKYLSCPSWSAACKALADLTKRVY
jgi:hypothetical protein